MDGDKILALAEKLDPFIAVLTSYKAKLVTAGFHEAIAEQMCIQMHAAMLTQAFAVVTKR